MSTLNFNNYENHRPHSLIYQDMEIVPEASPDRKTLVIVGSSDNQMPEEYQKKGLVLIGSTTDINKKLLPEVENPVVSSSNLLYQAAQIALSAGGGQAFYVLNVNDTTADLSYPAAPGDIPLELSFNIADTITVKKTVKTKVQQPGQEDVEYEKTTSYTLTSPELTLGQSEGTVDTVSITGKIGGEDITISAPFLAIEESYISLESEPDTYYYATESGTLSNVQLPKSQAVYDPSQSIYFLTATGYKLKNTISGWNNFVFSHSDAPTTEGGITTTVTTSFVIEPDSINFWSDVTLTDPVVLSQDVNTNAVKNAWVNALKILENTDRTMFVCPLTYNTDISKTVKEACTAISTPDDQKWKRVYQGVPACADGDNLDAATGDNASVNKIIESNARYNTLDPSVNQRSMNIWTAGSIIYTTDENDNVEETTLPNMMVAVGIAALRASLLVQQGLSMKTLTWIAGIPNNYLMFDKEDLNKIAVNGNPGTGKGTWIIAQDDADNEVYVRHQLTSDLTRGIMYYEDSVGVNVDSICYGIKDIVKPYIGQRNNTSDTLVEIRNRVIDYLLDLTNTGVSINDRRIGPQIKAVDLESVLVVLDGDLKDRVNIQFDIEIPLPINTIKVHVNAYADLNDR